MRIFLVQHENVRNLTISSPVFWSLINIWRIWASQNEYHSQIYRTDLKAIIFQFSTIIPYKIFERWCHVLLSLYERTFLCVLNERKLPDSMAYGSPSNRPAHTLSLKNGDKCCHGPHGSGVFQEVCFMGSSQSPQASPFIHFHVTCMFLQHHHLTWTRTDLCSTFYVIAKSIVQLLL